MDDKADATERARQTEKKSIAQHHVKKMRNRSVTCLFVDVWLLRGSGWHYLQTHMGYSLIHVLKHYLSQILTSLVRVLYPEPSGTLNT